MRVESYRWSLCELGSRYFCLNFQEKSHGFEGTSVKVCSEDIERSEGGYPANRADCSIAPGARVTSRTTLCFTVCVVIIRVLS